MNKETATSIAADFTPDLRRQRADAMINATMQALDRYIDPDNRKEVYYALQELYIQKGIDVVTDHDREVAGLPKRGDKGWTAEELAALELRRMEALLRPMPPIAMPTR